MGPTEIIILVASIITTLVVVFIVFAIIFAHQKSYPTLQINVDITGKRINSDDEALDYYLINFGTKDVLDHIEEIKDYKKRQIIRVSNNPKKMSKLEKYWLKNDHKAFDFTFYRTRTRYTQKNYVRSGYKVEEEEYSFYVCEKTILDRIDFLKEHDFYVTYDQFNRKDQRNALTSKLREMIKVRDNYTCQICGKYMPDEVGLHIDHVIPVSKGGKSVPENLRVLCSKCNGRKGNNFE